jgi:hypothetical protein
MTAKGKINASKVQPGDRVIVAPSKAEGRVNISSTKTGEGVHVARVIAKVYAPGANRRPGFYVVTTSSGTFHAAPIETMWLAPEDNAGIKRARAEAEIEDTNRAMIARELESQKAEKDAGVIVPDQGKALDASSELAQTLVNADHAEALTLHSHDGKVVNMNNASTATETQTAPADLGHRVEIDEAHRLPVQNHTGSTVVALLERVWSRIREDHPELPEVVITTGSGEGTKWGHFRPESWKVRAEEGAAITSTGPGRRHELFLASEALAKGANQVLQTMLHEAGHTLSRVRDIKDTSRQGRWHNAQFRKAAEEMGLEHKASAADKSHGFSFVTLTEATKDQYRDLLAELECELVLTGMLPSWLGGTGDEDEQGGEKITGKPKKTGGATSGNVKATCTCEEPNIIRLSRKVLDKRVVQCDDCDSLFTEAD